MKQRQSSLVLALVAVFAVAACDKDKPGGAAAGASGSTSAAGSAVSAAGSAAAASGSVTTAPLASGAASAATGPTTAHKGRRGGPATWMLSTAEKLPTLTPEQTTKIEALHKSLAADEMPQTAAYKDYRTELASEVKAGKIDATKLEASYAAMDKIIAARTDKEAEALNGLYAAVDATQRKAIADSIRAKQKMAELNEPKPDAWKKHRIDRMTKKLSLDADQVKKVDAIAPKAAPDAAAMEAKKADMKKRMETLLKAFEAPGFDAKKLDIGIPAGDRRKPMQMEAEFLTQLLPILKPEQRELLATSLAEPHPRAHPGWAVEHEIEQVFGEMEEAISGDAKPAGSAP